jgi:hypothetical protein
MGMFDEIECFASLPDGWEPKSLFQTNDLNNLLEIYTISSDGILDLEGHTVPFTGKIEMYASNVVVVAPEGWCTKNDEPYYSREYVATFEEGKLTQPIELLSSSDGNESYTSKPHLTIAEHREIFRKKHFKE